MSEASYIKSNQWQITLFTCSIEIRNTHEYLKSSIAEQKKQTNTKVSSGTSRTSTFFKNQTLKK